MNTRSNFSRSVRIALAGILSFILVWPPSLSWAAAPQTPRVQLTVHVFWTTLIGPGGAPLPAPQQLDIQNANVSLEVQGNEGQIVQQTDANGNTVFSVPQNTAGILISGNGNINDPDIGPHPMIGQIDNPINMGAANRTVPLELFLNEPPPPNPNSCIPVPGHGVQCPAEGTSATSSPSPLPVPQVNQAVLNAGPLERLIRKQPGPGPNQASYTVFVAHNDPNKTPVSGASVFLNNADGTPFAMGTTGPNGECTIVYNPNNGFLPPGNPTPPIRISASIGPLGTVCTVTQNGILSNGGRGTVAIPCPPPPAGVQYLGGFQTSFQGQLLFQMQDPNGKPTTGTVGGMTVRLHVVYNGGSGYGNIYTNREIIYPGTLTGNGTFQMNGELLPQLFFGTVRVTQLDFVYNGTSYTIPIVGGGGPGTQTQQSFNMPGSLMVEAGTPINLGPILTTLPGAVGS